ncbi:MAG: hypothetical protein Q4D98_04725 [Planctomycetia bacterium]|nr:hypothetical protein [Planctomycetia bacterium]
MPLTSAEMDALYENSQSSTARNVGVGLAALAFTMLFFWAAPKMLRVDSDKHFLVNMPLSGVDSLEPLAGTTAPPTTDGMEDQTILVILWTPWSTDSCRMLHALAPTLQAAGRSTRMRVIPVVYSTESPKEHTEEGITQEQIDMAMQQKDSLLRHVRQACTANGFQFGQIWWDPVDSFRSSLMGIALTVDPHLKTQIDGIGFPTLLYVQGGVIRYVWSGYNEKNLEEIRTQLELLRMTNTNTP